MRDPADAKDVPAGPLVAHPRAELSRPAERHSRFMFTIQEPDSVSPPGAAARGTA